VAVWLGAASAFFYAGTVLSGKFLLGEFGPLELQVYHSFGSAALLAPLAAPALAQVPAQALVVLIAAGLVLGLGGGLAFYAGLKLVPAQHAGVLTYLGPAVP